MKIWLDDERHEPVGWVRAKTAPEAIELLETNKVSEISLDHDLGVCEECLYEYEVGVEEHCSYEPDYSEPPSECEHNGNGYHVVCRIEEMVFADTQYRPPIIHIHTQNASARVRMMQAVKAIEQKMCNKLTTPDTIKR
jgi:hypothetical protein